ncbi:hypothetical protein FQZ97_974940 [compost metagenome]
MMASAPAAGEPVRIVASPSSTMLLVKVRLLPATPKVEPAGRLIWPLPRVLLPIAATRPVPPIEDRVRLPVRLLALLR